MQLRIRQRFSRLTRQLEPIPTSSTYDIAACPEHQESRVFDFVNGATLSTNGARQLALMRVLGGLRDLSLEPFLEAWHFMPPRPPHGPGDDSRAGSYRTILRYTLHLGTQRCRCASCYYSKQLCMRCRAPLESEPPYM